MIRKSVLTDNNIEYEEFYTPAEDYRLWARLMDVTHFYNIQETLVKYRWTGDNTSARLNAKTSEKHDNIQAQICDKHPFLRHQLINFRADRCFKFRLRLFSVIPLLKIKNNKIYLFEFIPILAIKWR